MRTRILGLLLCLPMLLPQFSNTFVFAEKESDSSGIGVLYDWIVDCDTYYKIYKDGKEGIAKPDGTVVLDAIYDDIDVDDEDLIFLAESDQMYEVYNIEGKKLSEYTKEKYNIFGGEFDPDSNTIYISDRYDDSSFLVSYEGEYLTDPNLYESIYEVYSENWYYQGDTYFQAYNHYSDIYHLIDSVGNVIIESKYYTEYRMILDAQYHAAGFWAITDLRSYSNPLRRDQTLVQQYDINGRLLYSVTLEGAYSNIQPDDDWDNPFRLFTNDRAVLDDFENFYILNTDGTMTCLGAYEEIAAFGENYFITEDANGAKGLVNSQGNVIIPCNSETHIAYDYFYCKGTAADGRVLHVFGNGTIFDNRDWADAVIYPYQDGYLVEVSGDLLYTDANGNVLQTLADCHEVSFPEEYHWNEAYDDLRAKRYYGVFQCHTSGTPRWFVKEKDGWLVEIEKTNNESSDFITLNNFNGHEKVVIANESNAPWCGVIGADGLYERLYPSHCSAMRLENQEEYYTYSNEYLVTVGDEKIGVIDASGKEVLPCIYTSATFGINAQGDSLLYFEDAQGNWLGSYFDANFNLLFQNQISDTFERRYYSTWDGLYTMREEDIQNEKDAKEGLVDRDGEILIPCEYSDISYANGYAIATRDAEDADVEKSSFRVYDVKNKTMTPEVFPEGEYNYSSIRSDGMNEYGYAQLDCNYYAWWDAHSDYFTIDTNGNILFHTGFDHPLSEFNGMTYHTKSSIIGQVKNGALLNENYWYLSRKDDNTVFTTINEKRYAVVLKEKDGSWGIVDEHNNIVVPFIISKCEVTDPFLYSAKDDGYFSNPLTSTESDPPVEPEDSTPINFVPLQPDSDTVHSTVLDGGTVRRYYLVKTDDGALYANKTIRYTIGDTVCRAKTDANGLFVLTIPDVYAPYGMSDYTQWFHAQIVAADGSKRPNVSNAPSILVDIQPRGYTQSAEISAEAGVFIGGDADVVSAEAGLKANKKLGVEYKHSGGDTDKIDLTLRSLQKSTLSGSAGAGLFGSLWGNDLPSLDFTAASVGASGSIGYGGSMVFEDFYNTDDPAHTEKALSAGLYTLETLYTGIINSPVAGKAIDILHSKLTDEGASARNTETTLALSAGNEAELNINNVLTENTALSASVYSGKDSAVWKFTTDEPLQVSAETPRKRSAELTTEATTEFFKLGIEQTFASDSKTAVSKDILTAKSANTQTRRSISTEIDETGNIQALHLETQWPTTNYQDFTIGLNDYTTNETFSVSVKDDTVDEVLENSAALQGFVNGTAVLPSANAFTEAFEAMSNIQDEGEWKLEGEETRLFSQPLKIPVAPKISLGIEISGKESISYAKKSGVYSSDYFLVNDEYDGTYYTNQKEPMDYITLVGAAMVDVLKDFTDEIISAGKSLVELGKAKVDKIGGSINILITTIGSGNTPLTLLSLAADDGDLDTAYSVGDVYIVTAVDENQNPIEEFEPGSMTLSLSYAGFSCDTDKLDIYRWDEALGLYQKCGAVLDKVNQTLSIPFMENGQYILGVDTSKPSISEFTYTTIDGQPYLTAKIRDDFSAIDTNTIEMAIDTTVVIDKSNIEEYFDLRTGILQYPIETEWEGVHQATILAGDSSGNLSDAAQLTFSYVAAKPQIIHTPVTNAQIDSDIAISADIICNGNATAYLAYKNLTTGISEKLIEMTKNDGRFTATIPGEDVSEDIVYYIIASDEYGNMTTSSNYYIWIAQDTPICISSTDITKQGNTVQLAAEFIKQEAEQQPCTILAAAYDENNVLIALQKDELTDIPDFHTFTFEQGGKIKLVKVYVWNSLNEIHALSKAVNCYLN